MLYLVLAAAGADKCKYKSEFLEFCIHADPNYKAHNLEETQTICSALNSTSLEIHNQSYQFEIGKLIKSDPSFTGHKYYLNLGYKNEVLMWLTSSEIIRFICQLLRYVSLICFQLFFLIY